MLKDLHKERYLNLHILDLRVNLIKTVREQATLGSYLRFKIISDQVTIIRFKNQHLSIHQETIKCCPRPE